MTFFETIQPALTSLLATVLTVVFSYIGLEIKRLYQRYCDTEEKKSIVDSTVKYIEQVYSHDLNGPDKLAKATETASASLEKAGLSVSPKELRTLIEAAVHGLDKGIHQEEKKDAGPAI